MNRRRTSRRIQTRHLRLVSEIGREPANPEDYPDGDGQTTRYLFRARTRDYPRTAAQQRRLLEYLTDEGVIEPQGCDCHHCRMDWDCCGRLFVSYTRIDRTRRGFAITQHYSRNV